MFHISTAGEDFSGVFTCSRGGESCSLELIGLIRRSGVRDIHIPEGIKELPSDADPCYTRIGKP